MGLLYFADGNGANLTKEAYVVDGSALACVVPVTTATTAAYFTRTNSTRDKIVFTHDDKTTTSGHRCREIGAALAAAANSHMSAGTMIDIADLDNSKFFKNLSFITGLVVHLSTSETNTTIIR